MTHVKTSKQVTEKPTLSASEITKHNRAKESKGKCIYKLAIQRVLIRKDKKMYNILFLIIVYTQVSFICKQIIEKFIFFNVRTYVNLCKDYNHVFKSFTPFSNLLYISEAFRSFFNTHLVCTMHFFLSYVNTGLYLSDHKTVIVI